MTGYNLEKWMLQYVVDFTMPCGTKAWWSEPAPVCNKDKAGRLNAFSMVLKAIERIIPMATEIGVTTLENGRETYRFIVDEQTCHGDYDEQFGQLLSSSA